MYNEGVTDYSLFVRPQGTLKAVMLFVDFPGRPSGQTIPALFESLTDGMPEWYEAVSAGRMSLDIDPVFKWYHLPRGLLDYFKQDTSQPWDKEGYLSDTVTAADDDVDFSKYSFVYIARPAPDNIGGTVLALPQNKGIQADGVTVRHSVFLNSGNRTTGRPSERVLGSIHETAHIFGVPDLYDFDTGGYSYAGNWDIMSYAPANGGFLAWHLAKFGWLNADQLICIERGEVTATLSPIERSEGLRAVVVRLSATTAYVIEARDPNGSMFCKSGVLVYSVDLTLRGGTGPIRIKPSAGGTSARQSRCGELSDAPFGIGPGDVTSYADAAIGLSIEVTGRDDRGYSVRVSKT